MHCIIILLAICDYGVVSGEYFSTGFQRVYTLFRGGNSTVDQQEVTFSQRLHYELMIPSIFLVTSTATNCQVTQQTPKKVTTDNNIFYKQVPACYFVFITISYRQCILYFDNSNTLQALIK